MEMLQTINHTEIFDQRTGLNPFLHLDGHGSCFDPEFSEPETKWNYSMEYPMALPTGKLVTAASRMSH
jgi:hypothetical protein